MFAEYRIEVFRPPCWFNLTAKPQIERMDDSTWDLEDGVNVMQYVQPFALQYSMLYATDMVTSAVLVTPGSGTHSTNMNQRVVRRAGGLSCARWGCGGGEKMESGGPRNSVWDGETWSCAWIVTSW